jgi:hypothetical protein
VQQIASGLTLDQLERDLQDLSHGQEALTRIQSFSAGLKKTAARQLLFNAAGALICDPIDHQAALEAGKIPASEDEFRLLQGDLITTETAYFLGERITGQARFVVASSSCDLIENRRQYASLLRVKPLRAEDPNVKEQLNILLKFASSKAMYLPPLIDDPDGLVGQAVDFDGVVQVRLTDLLLAKREASLSLIGWRIFGSMLRAIMVRAGDHEASLRK